MSLYSIHPIEGDKWQRVHLIGPMSTVIGTLEPIELEHLARSIETAQIYHEKERVERLKEESHG